MRLVILSVALALVGAAVSMAAPPRMQIVLAAHRALACDDCHGVAEPTAAPPETACARCHGTNGRRYRGHDGEYVDDGKKIVANMHQSHIGPVECFRCHANHRPPPESLFCNTCHHFAVTAK